MIEAYIAFQKCLVQTLFHIVVIGSLVINYDYRYTIELKDSIGARTKRWKLYQQTSQILAWDFTCD